MIMTDEQKLFNDVVVAVFASIYNNGVNEKIAVREAYEAAERFMIERKALGYDKKLDPMN